MLLQWKAFEGSGKFSQSSPGTCTECCSQHRPETPKICASVRMQLSEVYQAIEAAWSLEWEWVDLVFPWRCGEECYTFRLCAGQAESITQIQAGCPVGDTGPCQQAWVEPPFAEVRPAPGGVRSPPPVSEQGWASLDGEERVKPAWALKGKHSAAINREPREGGADRMWPGLELSDY